MLKYPLAVVVVPTATAEIICLGRLPRLHRRWPHRSIPVSVI
jgi:hypothetical protein